MLPSPTPSPASPKPPRPVTTPVYRVIEGVLYRRAETAYAFDARVHNLGHGHLEATVQPRFGWHEVDALTPQALADYQACLVDAPKLTEKELLDKAAMNRDRSTRRARTAVRRLAKFKGLTTLLTLTYRENMQDRERLVRDVDVFLKRVRRAIPTFEYICVFERQKRGAWHAHFAVRKVQPWYLSKGVMVRSYDLLRSMWRAVVGTDNGNIDVSRNKAVSRSSAKLAAYLSKYIGKTFDQAEKHVNAYSASGRALPPAVSERLLTDSQATAIAQLFDLIEPEVAAQCEFHSAHIDGGGYFLCLSPPIRRR